MPKAAAGVKVPCVEFHLNRDSQVMVILVVCRFENAFIIQTGIDSPKSTEIVSEAHSAAYLYESVGPKQVTAYPARGVGGDTEAFVSAFRCCCLGIRLYGNYEYCNE